MVNDALNFDTLPFETLSCQFPARRYGIVSVAFAAVMLAVPVFVDGLVVGVVDVELLLVAEVAAAAVLLPAAGGVVVELEPRAVEFTVPTVLLDVVLEDDGEVVLDVTGADGIAVLEAGVLVGKMIPVMFPDALKVVTLDDVGVVLLAVLAVLFELLVVVGPAAVLGLAVLVWLPVAAVLVLGFAE
ncbi:MAG: hypothetical protein ABI361_00240 [Nitrososphaera sp.]